MIPLSLSVLVVLLPLAAFVVLVLFGGLMGERAHRIVGTAPAGIAAALAITVGAGFLVSPPGGRVFTQVLWTWLSIDDFAPRMALRLDPLSMIMMLVVTCVGFLILVYSTDFMHGEEGGRRFFAYMNLFIFSMLVLVLADDLLFMFVGWEGVGLCSYLLIGFWYRDPVNGAAARKAFIVTRVGDAALLVGLLLIFTQLGTSDIQAVMGSAQQGWVAGSAVATAAALLVLGGAIGKSAQLPLQTWLPDAMVGPTPVSALIHAATMVTAGVYLIARTHVLFTLSPVARAVVVVIGAATLLSAGLAALAQRDIKRVLAYSTISQIGYMFLALGVGAWTAAIFHLMTHAFFKALLFLTAGLVIRALGGEHDIHKMGGLRRELPWVFWTFLAGAASLAAVPGITAGFFSKDLIIASTLTSSLTSSWGGVGLWSVAVVGAFITSLYAFRLVFVVFFGERTTVAPAGPRRPAAAAVVPVVLLAVMAVVGGWVQSPFSRARVSLFADFLAPVLGPPPEAAAGGGAFAGGPAPQVIAVLLSLLGILGAYLLFGRRRPVAPPVAPPAGSPAGPSPVAGSPMVASLTVAAREGFGFDRFYSAVLVRPFFWLARKGKDDIIDVVLSSIGWLVARLHRLLSLTQSGRLRYYVGVAAAGVVVFVAVGVLR